MKDEPRRHPLYLLALLVCALGTAPFSFIGSEARMWLGLPVWLWASIGFTLALSVLTAWGILRYWDDDDAETGE